MQEAAGREAFAQPADQLVGHFALGRADGGGVPFLAIRNRRSTRRSARRPWSGARPRSARTLSTCVAERVQRIPAFVGKGLGDARMLGDAGDLHVEVEFGVGLAEMAAGDRRGVAVMRRGGQRDMAFAGEQAGGRIEADPAGAGQIDFAPGMQVGEIDFGAGGAVERLQVGRELDQVAGDEAGGEAQMAQDLRPAASWCRGRSRAPLSASPPASGRRAPCG